MITAFERLRPELETLPAAERAEIAQFLLTSLGPEDGPEAEAAWDAELERRVAEIQSGTAQGKPADRVFPELRERFR
jgi:putative addiction module component (TIGR02574 family)